MNREEACKTLIENLCAMCAYGSQNMESCDIRSCDNRDAIKALEQKPCEDAVSRKAVLNLARDLDFSKVKGLEHYKHRCIEIEDVEELESVTPDLSSLREINEALTKRVQYLEKMERYAMPGTPIHRDRTVQDFVDKCRECGARYGKQLKHLERIKARYKEERGILLNSNSEYTPNNVLDIIDYIIHGD